MMSVPVRMSFPSTLAAESVARAESLTLALVGSGGDGVALLGDLVLELAARQGLYGMMVQSYGPQIRGGESAAIVRLSRDEVQYEGDRTDLLLCFRTQDLKRFKGTVRIDERSVVILESADQSAPPDWLGHSAREPFRVPFARFENGVEVAGPPKNMIGLALVCRALGWPRERVEQLLGERFGKRAEVLERNREALRGGWAIPDVPCLPRLQGRSAGLLIESGNEAVARGAIEAGLGFFAGYPITPSSEVMETLIDELPAVGGTVVQAEDEIAALGMVLGASFGGVPAMTATSGPGLSLMTEMTGLSAMAELPAVIVDCQRAGPATGMPSRTEQSDLNHAVYAGHGDFPRAVLGAFDVVHARQVMGKAFHLAEKYQLPVLVLSDAYIAQRRQIRDAIEPMKKPAGRRRWTAGDGPARFSLEGTHGVVPFRVPGTPGGTYLAAGIEHTEQGSPTADTAIHQQMNAKRFRKLDAIAMETRDWYRVLGDPEARRGIVAWGSQYGLLREWTLAHPEYRVFLPEIIYPFPVEALRRFLQPLQWAGVLELSYQGQFHRYLSSLLPFERVASLSRSGGAPLSIAELSVMLGEVPR
jgi:2-oxoglutarate/2-oxoacid ferredoxin oxidoreductase subunit alpha